MDADVEVRAGEVVALLGDNGAGKSTFLKCLLGIVQPDAGRLLMRDEEVQPKTVREAQARGVDCVYQDLALAPDLSVVDNMFLGAAASACSSSRTICPASSRSPTAP